MRFVLLLVALLCALIAAGLGFDIIPSNDSLAEVHRLALAWLSVGFAAYVGALVVGEKP